MTSPTGNVITQMAQSAQYHIAKRYGIFLGLILAFVRPGFDTPLATLISVLMGTAEACIVVIWWFQWVKGSAND